MVIMSHGQMRSSDCSMGLNVMLSNVNYSIIYVKDGVHNDFAAVIIFFFFPTLLQYRDVSLSLCPFAHPDILFHPRWADELSLNCEELGCCPLREKKPVELNVQ